MSEAAWENWDVDAITLPEIVTGMTSQDDGLLVFGENGGIYLVDVENKTFVKIESDPQPNHIIVKE